MLNGKKVHLRPFRLADVEFFIKKVNTMEAKGDFLPLNMTNLIETQKKFNENGLITEESGRFVIVSNETEKTVGFVIYFKGTHYSPGYELGYIIYSAEDRGKGYASEALSILTRWIFLSKEVYRLQVCMDTENMGSQIVAEKCGYMKEGVMRGGNFSRGEYRDLLLYSMTRPDFKLLV